MFRLIVLFLFIFSFDLKAQILSTVTTFGSNPGNLEMLYYAPSNLTGTIPLVVAMHGCTQNATEYSTQSGWSTLAQNHSFIVIYPQQKTINNSNKCFNWFMDTDQNKDQGEAMSIKQMIDYIKGLYSIDNNKIFVTGLSAGACMSNVMMACYPDVFSKGAIFAGVPYKAATDVTGLNLAMSGSVSKTPTQWGDLVRAQNSSYSGSFPKVAVFQGATDFVVNANNATEIIKQWTNVNGVDETSDETQNSFADNTFVTRKIYKDTNEKSVAELYSISSFGHALALDTGSCYQHCGATGTYAYDINFNSTFWAADYFSILNAPYSIYGQTEIDANQTDASYSVPNVTGSSYNWFVPDGSTISNGQGTSAVTVNFGTNGGIISVTETNSVGCKIGPINLNVTLKPSSVYDNVNTQTKIIYHKEAAQLEIISTMNFDNITVYNLQGRAVLKTHQNMIDISNLSPGIYCLKIISSGISVTYKLLVF